jgi:epothilone polyketide synthase E
VGAGVGGTTKSLLPALTGIQAEYVYTDISKVFLVRGGQKFSNYSFLTRKIFDAEKQPSAQGIQEGYFDIVVASNVLHATKDIRATMRHVRALLRQYGLLFLWELTENQTWLDMTFALLEGWARHSDNIRLDRPTLSTPQWKDLMGNTGWPNIYHFPEDLSEAHVLGNTVFIAEAD